VGSEPLTLTCHEGRTVLLRQNLGGDPSDRILELDQGQLLDLTRFLRVAIGLTKHSAKPIGEESAKESLRP
jgi:hypothetical protein